MRFASLGSGSKGNALLVESEGTRVLIDCGFSVRETQKRLVRLSVSPEEIDAVLVSHEHVDHSFGVFGFCKRFDIPAYMTKGTYRAILREDAPPPRLIDSHSTFRIGNFDILPFPVPHDALEPVQFVVSDRRHSFGILTDTGRVTPHIVDTLCACDALVLECNHDTGMLMRSDYPEPLRRRIAGYFGHLSNVQAASLLQRFEGRLQHVVAAHLSERNNLPELALEALNSALDGGGARIGVACQKNGFPWLELA